MILIGPVPGQKSITCKGLTVVPIYITSFFRQAFTKRTLELIHERTVPGSFTLHVYDNGSDEVTRQYLYEMLSQGKITSVTLDSRNTGCMYNKNIFHVMTEKTTPYYVVTDNDVYPPKLSPDWLSQMISIMDKHPEIGALVPQIPPQSLQMPEEILDDVVYCKAIGNTLKVIRREAFNLIDDFFKIGAFGDDWLISRAIVERGYKVAFCRNIFCLHAGQCDNWGYDASEIAHDPRKLSYGTPYQYALANEETYEPVRELKI